VLDAIEEGRRQMPDRRRRPSIHVEDSRTKPDDSMDPCRVKRRRWNRTQPGAARVRQAIHRADRDQMETLPSWMVVTDGVGSM
jgi:hypothetical protein